MKKYKAIARGYDGIKVREVGEVFEFAGKPGKWMKALDGGEAAAPKAAPAPKGSSKKKAAAQPKASESEVVPESEEIPVTQADEEVI